MKTQEQVDSFHRFATEQLASGGTDKSIDELYDQWRYENMSLEELRENVAAVQAAINDMKAGDVGRKMSLSQTLWASVWRNLKRLWAIRFLASKLSIHAV